jgi:hypothetical protein
MDAGKGFTYVFDDPNWPVKIIIGGGIAIISGIVPIIGWIIGPLVLYGYAVEATRNIILKKPQPLPEWGNFGDKIVRGLVAYLIQFVWGIPMFVLWGLAGFGAALTDPNTARYGLEVVGILFASVFGIVGFLYLIFFLLVLPIATARYAATLNFGSAFEIGPILAILSRNIGNYFIVLLLTIVAGIIGSLGLIALFIGVFFTAFYSTLVTFGLYGFAYRADREWGQVSTV